MKKTTLVVIFILLISILAFSAFAKNDKTTQNNGNGFLELWAAIGRIWDEIATMNDNYDPDWWVESFFDVFVEINETHDADVADLQLQIDALSDRVLWLEVNCGCEEEPTWQCFDISYDDVEVCSGHGDCVSEDDCDCEQGWTGSDCTIMTCVPSAEVCDGIDNDCNPITPDGADEPSLNNYCNTGEYGICSSGVMLCVAGALQCVQETQLSAEECNGLDDDCDGATDEELTAPLCTLQEGVCAGSRATCASTLGWQCTTVNYGSSYELEELSCDDIDNDCDGIIDNPYRQEGYITFTDWDYVLKSKGADCGTGACVGGEVVCDTLISLTCSTLDDFSTEICDGSDNDCDGEADEDFDLNSDVNHCGICDRACADINVNTLSCSSGGCDSTCDSGYANCYWPDASIPDDGCETAGSCY